MRTTLAALAILGLACPASVGATDFTALTEQERSIFHQEIRQVLLSLPDLPHRDGPARVPARFDPYAEDIADDLARIAAHADALFSPDLPGFGAADAPLAVAFFTAPDCPDCARAEAELRSLADRHPIRVTLLDISAHADLAHVLGLDTTPSYVMPDRMLRGHMPAIVLERYFSE